MSGKRKYLKNKPRRTTTTKPNTMGLLIKKDAPKKGKAPFRISNTQVTVRVNRGVYSIEVLSVEEVEKQRIQSYDYAVA